jgi:small-conductance mechanosensitive channel
MNCKYCHQELPAGRSNRQYCSLAHKQAHYRQSRQAQTTIVLTEQAEYVERLQALLAIERSRNDELEQQVTRLTTRLDIERRYYDSQPRAFRGWLRKQPRTDLIGRLLERDTFPLKGSRALYEAHVRVLKGPESDLQEFADLWRCMLLSVP